ncbi:MAG: hypothetical protein KY455_13520 [Euryarchaeota archaeon]|nr:hypothetical protein [Euryarchaeota archaeon]
MQILPAIDLRGDTCVRLRQGDYQQETVFSDDPVEMARRWVAEGAERLHLVEHGVDEGLGVDDGDAVAVIDDAVLEAAGAAALADHDGPAAEEAGKELHLGRDALAEGVDVGEDLQDEELVVAPGDHIEGDGADVAALGDVIPGTGKDLAYEVDELEPRLHP